MCLVVLFLCFIFNKKLTKNTKNATNYFCFDCQSLFLVHRHKFVRNFHFQAVPSVLQHIFASILHLNSLLHFFWFLFAGLCIVCLFVCFFLCVFLHQTCLPILLIHTWRSYWIICWNRHGCYQQTREIMEDSLIAYEITKKNTTQTLDLKLKGIYVYCISVG